MGRMRAMIGQTPRKASNPHLSGIDSVRFVCALIVMLGHLHPLPDLLHGEGRPLVERIAAGVFNGLFNGPAAVIVFFIISGLCIHLPFREGASPTLAAFYTRRMLRLLIPAAAHLLLLRVTTGFWQQISETILWSVLCEAIYYAAYPALLALRRRTGWLPLLLLAWAGAAITIATNLPAVREGGNQFVALGLGKTWILGLPCWLAGCWLAENFRRFPTLSGAWMWAARLALIACMVGVHLLRSHGTSLWASNCITLELFAPLAAAYIACEMLWSQAHEPLRWLERAGRWSYSVYLAHPLAFRLLILWQLRGLAETYGGHALFLAATLAVSYLFFLLIERPSHRLAIALSRRVEVLSKSK